MCHELGRLVVGVPNKATEGLAWGFHANLPWATFTLNSRQVETVGILNYTSRFSQTLVCCCLQETGQSCFPVYNILTNPVPAGSSGLGILDPEGRQRQTLWFPQGVVGGCTGANKSNCGRPWLGLLL